MQQQAAAKAKLFKQTQYAVLVKEMFTPPVDTLKRKEVETRKSITKNPRTVKLTPSDHHPPHTKTLESKSIPPEARGKARRKESSTNAVSHKPSYATRDKDKDSQIQFGNLRLVKSAKQVAEERDATVGRWHARAQSILDAIQQKETQLVADPLAPLEVRFTKHAMVSSMYTDAISAKLDLLAEMCGAQ